MKSSASKYTDIPEDYKPLDNVVNSEDWSPDAIIMTTMPPTKAPGDSHNQTEWIARSATKLKVLNQPGFPRPVPKPAHLNYVVKQTDKMGKGVFATRDIGFGELVFAERPLLVVPANCNISGIVPPAHYNMEQQKRIVMTEWEKKLNIVVEERMTEEDRKAFKELQNSHTEDGSPPILGVIRTNGFGILRNFDADDFAMTGSYTAIGKIASRVNHRYYFFSNSIYFLMKLTFLRTVACPMFCVLFRRSRSRYSSQPSKTSKPENSSSTLTRHQLYLHKIVKRISPPMDSYVNATPASTPLQSPIAFAKSSTSVSHTSTS